VSGLSPHVWIEESEGWSALCSRIANPVIVILSLDLLAGAWRVISLVPQWRLVAALLVLSLTGTVAVAALRRIERLDDVTAES
jgi:TctA family transporter